MKIGVVGLSLPRPPLFLSLFAFRAQQPLQEDGKSRPHTSEPGRAGHSVRGRAGAPALSSRQQKTGQPRPVKDHADALQFVQDFREAKGWHVLLLDLGRKEAIVSRPQVSTQQLLSELRRWLQLRAHFFVRPHLSTVVL